MRSLSDKVVLVAGSNALSEADTIRTCSAIDQTAARLAGVAEAIRHARATYGEDNYAPVINLGIRAAIEASGTLYDELRKLLAEVDYELLARRQRAERQ